MVYGYTVRINRYITHRTAYKGREQIIKSLGIANCLKGFAKVWGTRKGFLNLKGEEVFTGHETVFLEGGNRGERES